MYFREPVVQNGPNEAADVSRHSHAQRPAPRRCSSLDKRFTSWPELLTASAHPAPPHPVICFCFSVLDREEDVESGGCVYPYGLRVRWCPQTRRPAPRRHSSPALGPATSTLPHSGRKIRFPAARCCDAACGAALAWRGAWCGVHGHPGDWAYLSMFRVRGLMGRRWIRLTAEGLFQE